MFAAPTPTVSAVYTHVIVTVLPFVTEPPPLTLRLASPKATVTPEKTKAKLINKISKPCFLLIFTPVNSLFHKFL